MQNSFQTTLDGPALLRATVTVFVRSLVAGGVAGTVLGWLLHLAIRPDCTVGGQLFCGLGEALVAIAAGCIVGMGVFTWTGVRRTRDRLPSAQQRKGLALVLFAWPVAFASLYLFVGLLASI